MSCHLPGEPLSAHSLRLSRTIMSAPGWDGHSLPMGTIHLKQQRCATARVESDGDGFSAAIGNRRWSAPVVPYHAVAQDPRLGRRDAQLVEARLSASAELALPRSVASSRSASNPGRPPLPSASPAETLGQRRLKTWTGQHCREESSTHSSPEPASHQLPA